MPLGTLCPTLRVSCLVAPGGVAICPGALGDLLDLLRFEAFPEGLLGSPLNQSYPWWSEGTSDEKINREREKD